MSTAAHTTQADVPPPERGERVFLDGLPGGPWPTVVDGRDGDLLSIAPPRSGGRRVELPLGRAFTVAYSVREVPCEVDAVLVGAPSSGGADAYVARLTGTVRRMQRRRAVRVPVGLLVQARLDEEGDPDPDAVIGAVTENLSAGGALLRSSRALEPGRELRLSVRCGGTAGTLDLAGRVVRCDRQTGEERPWRLAIAFHDIPAGDEDRLVRFLFERQRELRHRAAGLG
jgi:hypothetical protein